MLLLIAALFASSAQAQMEGPLFLAPQGPPGMAPATQVKYQTGRWAGNRGTSLDQHSLNASVPLYNKDEHSWSMSARAGLWDLESSARLPAYGMGVLEKLYDVQAGLSYSHTREGQGSWGGNLQVGSQSNKPFDTLRETTLSLSGYRAFARKESSQWILIANYSNNRSFLNNIPIVGVAYSYAPSKDFSAVFGAPFVFIRWVPKEKWVFTYFGLIPWNHRIELSHFVFGPIQVMATFESVPSLFLLADRADSRERLFYDERKASIGVKSPISKILSLELRGGYAFDRSMFQAQNYREPVGGRAYLGSTWFGTVGVSLRR